MISDKILEMINALQEYKNHNDNMMIDCVKSRLEKSFNQYDKELQQSIQYLTRKHEKSLTKRITKL